MNVCSILQVSDNNVRSREKLYVSNPFFEVKYYSWELTNHEKLYGVEYKYCMHYLIAYVWKG